METYKCIKKINFFIISWVFGNIFNRRNYFIFYLIEYRYFCKRCAFFWFFETLLLATFLNLILVFILKYLGRLKIFCSKDLIILVILFIFGHYTIYGLIPFNASRSVSIILMSYFLKNENKEVTNIEIKSYVEKIYFKESNSVEKRLKEQVELCHLEYYDEKYKITSKGVRNIKIIGYNTDLYKTDKNYINIEK